MLRFSCSNTSRRLADTEQEVDDLKRLNDELNRKLREQTAKVGFFAVMYDSDTHNLDARADFF